MSNVGTPGYIAPEMSMGHPVTFATDVFSLGVTALEVVSLRPQTAESLKLQSYDALCDDSLGRCIERMCARLIGSEVSTYSVGGGRRDEVMCVRTPVGSRTEVRVARAVPTYASRAECSVSPSPPPPTGAMRSGPVAGNRRAGPRSRSLAPWHSGTPRRVTMVRHRAGCDL